MTTQTLLCTPCLEEEKERVHDGAEEVQSLCGYWSGYKRKTIAEQMDQLRGAFSGIALTADERLDERVLPPRAEGWFAVPRWQSVAPTYGEAVRSVFELLKGGNSGRFANMRDGTLDEAHVRRNSAARELLQVLEDQQRGYSVLILPCQLGLHHRGRSVRRARLKFEKNEFGLGAFECGVILLTHPERLQHPGSLWIDCAGDEYSPMADDRFSLAPCFEFVNGRLAFQTYWIGDAREHYGAASGFLTE